jgi:hypothetical protein
MTKHGEDGLLMRVEISIYKIWRYSQDIRTEGLSNDLPLQRWSHSGIYRNAGIQFFIFRTGV